MSTHTKSLLNCSTSSFLFKSYFLFIISFVFFSANSTSSLIFLIVLRNFSISREFSVDKFMSLLIFRWHPKLTMKGDHHVLELSWLGKTAKLLFIFLFFFFYFILDLLYRRECGKVSHHKCHITWQGVIMSYDRCGKIVHRPCSSCINSVKNLIETLSSSLCQLLNKEQLALFWLGV